MSIKVGALAAAGRDDSSSIVIFIVGGIVLLVFIAAWITNSIRDRRKKLNINRQSNHHDKDARG
jgi:hypothetical protein